MLIVIWCAPGAVLAGCIAISVLRQRQGPSQFAVNNEIEDMTERNVMPTDSDYVFERWFTADE
jgi:hypothetical protein